MNVLVLSREGRFERRLALGKDCHPRTAIMTAALQRGKLVIGTRTTGDRTFTLSRLPG